MQEGSQFLVQQYLAQSHEHYGRKLDRRYGVPTKATHGSPMTKLSPALMDGTSPNEPTRAAAASLRFVTDEFILINIDS